MRIREYSLCYARKFGRKTALCCFSLVGVRWAAGIFSLEVWKACTSSMRRHLIDALVVRFQTRASVPKFQRPKASITYERSPNTVTLCLPEREHRTSSLAVLVADFARELSTTPNSPEGSQHCNDVTNTRSLTPPHIVVASISSREFLFSQHGRDVAGCVGEVGDDHGDGHREASQRNLFICHPSLDESIVLSISNGSRRVADQEIREYRRLSSSARCVIHSIIYDDLTCISLIHQQLAASGQQEHDQLTTSIHRYHSVWFRYVAAVARCWYCLPSPCSMSAFEYPQRIKKFESTDV
nr:hypothetical protein CFP56_41281 [Quercus suber]